MNSKDNHDLNKNLNDSRDRMIEKFSQSIMTMNLTDNEIAQFIVEKLGLPTSNTNTITCMNINDTHDQQMPTISIVSKHSYPPLNQTGLVNDHDRPYADYGHLDRQEIAQECHFNLSLPSSSSLDQVLTQFYTKSFAITSCTNASKNLVMQNIQDEFNIENIQYICIGEEINELNDQQMLHIQIIFKENVDRKGKAFLDGITGTYCNYQVTQNDCAWNEYIKQGDNNYIEFNEFKSIIIHEPKQWPSSPFVSTSKSDNLNQRTMTVRTQTEERQQHRREIAEQAIKLAEINIDKAIKLIQREINHEIYRECYPIYHVLFSYIHLQAQRDAERRGTIYKEFIWPHSFPNCTPKLREAINEWIENEFSRTQNAKCLVLIGPTNTGKTSFALSLPGHVNYFQGCWNKRKWNKYARYSVYDEIPWDDFEKLNYPNKKHLLTQQGHTIYEQPMYDYLEKSITFRQPAIVLLNSKDAGTLTAPSVTHTDRKASEYWEKRAFIYIMGPDEYFSKRQPKVKTNATD